MHEEQSAKYLINEVLDMVLAELLPRVDYSVQVSLHQFSDDIDVSVASACLRLQDIQQSDYVVVFEKSFLTSKVRSNLISRTILLASIRS